MHKPADSWTERKKQEKMREKIEAAKGKRSALDKLSRNKALGEEDGDDDALRWVERMRENEKRKAEERARLLDTMDEEFTNAEEKPTPKKTTKKVRLRRLCLLPILLCRRNLQKSRTKLALWPACRSSTIQTSCLRRSRRYLC